MNTFGVVHVPADQVGPFLGISGGAVLVFLVLAFVNRDDTDSPSRGFLSLAATAAIFFVTLALSAAAS